MARLGKHTPVSHRKCKEIFIQTLRETEFAALTASEEPTILRGAVSEWPLVQKGMSSTDEAIDYLIRFSGERQLTQFSGQPEMRGKFFYNADVTSFNFRASQVTIPDFFNSIRSAQTKQEPDHFYVGSTDLDLYFPGLRENNDLVSQHAVLSGQSPIVSIWMGNRTTAAAHYDMSNNVACCMVGRRRFTLFPPEQIENLYPGPLEPTPAGQVVSMVDFIEPDFDQHPKFREAMKTAQVADLEPGDILFYPALWWHQVEALDPFNVMINYWWNEAPAFMDTPMLTLLHGVLSLRDRSPQEKAAWKAMLDYYVFDDRNVAGRHLPDHTLGALAPLDATQARRLRAQILKRMNR